MSADTSLPDDIAPLSRWRRFRVWLAGLPVRTMVLSLLLMGAIFATRGRWGAWVCTAILKGHTNRIRSVAFFPDGERIVTAGSWDDAVRVWDTATGECLRILSNRAQPNWVPDLAWCVAVSPDGSRLAVGGEMPPQVKVFEVQTGECVLSLDGSQNLVTSVAYSLDGKRMVTSSHDGTARAWCADTGACVTTLKHKAFVHRAEFSPDCKRILTAGDEGLARIWDAATGQCLLALRGHAAGIEAACFSPDGAEVLAVSNGDGSARVWRPETGDARYLWRGRQEVGVYTVTYSPDGRRILTAEGDKTAKVWDARAGKCIAVLRGHTDHVLSATFSPDGRLIATGGMDEIAKVWRRRRPEWWWGIFWLPEFWGLFALGCALAWSVWHDVKAMRAERRAAGSR